VEGIDYNQRVFVAGQNRSGKSEFVNLVFSGFRCQRFLLDTKGGEWSIPGVEPTADVGSIDWRQPIIHYVTQTSEVDEIDEVFCELNHRRNIVVCVHELGDLCGHSTNRTPASVNRYYSQGGAWGRGIVGASQLPVDMPKRAKTEAQHVVVFVPALTEDDLKTIARMLSNIDAGELKAMIEETEREFGQYSFIWFRKSASIEPVAFPPLPAHLRDRIIVKRSEGVS
jgi:hypothetical protein